MFAGLPLFQAYADQLHSHPLLVAVFSSGLSLIFALHIITGTLLTWQNKIARDRGYKVQKRAVTRANSQASATMIYSGLFLLLFVVLHTTAVSFGDHATIGKTIAEMFSSTVELMRELAEGEHDPHPEYGTGWFKEWGMYPVRIVAETVLPQSLKKT